MIALALPPSVRLLAVLAVAVSLLPVAAQAEGAPTESVVVRLVAAEDANAVAASLGDAPPRAGSPLALDVTAAELDLLRRDSRVLGVLSRGAVATAALAQSVPLTGAPTMWSGGETGAGKVIVVVDTGVSASFGGTLVGQACFAASQVQSSTQLVGHCGPGEDEERAFSATCFDLGVCDASDPYFVPDADAGRPCPSPPASRPSACAHGSAVAAVAARSTAPKGVAPGADVYAIRVFNPEGTGADLVDVFYALDHVVRLVDAGLDVAAVNLSLATGSLYSGACDAVQEGEIDGPAFAAVLADLRDRGVAVTVASGNDGVAGRIAFPACLSTAVAVGATDLTDRIAPFSNTATAMDLLAPGATSGSSSLVIPSGTGYSQWAGTSFAAPHVAGAYALLDGRYPEATIDQRLWFLRTAGVAVQEGAVAHRRLALKPSAQVLLAGLMFPGQAVIAGSSREALGDIDGDGRTDVVAHRPGSGVDRLSYGEPGWTFDVRSYAINASYLPVVGNFTGAVDGPDDIIWYAPGASADHLWSGSASRVLPSTPVSLTGYWTPLQGDFDGDGWDDVLWYAPGASADRVWYGGSAGPQVVSVTVGGSYTAGVGDFNGDGRDDLLLDGVGTATDSLWRGTSTRGTFVRTPVALEGTSRPVVANIDGDGDDDVVVYRAGAPADAIWRGGPGVGTAGGTGGFTAAPLAINNTYAPVAGDLDDDDDDEILWYAAGPTPDTIWFGRPAGLPTGRSVSVSGSYRPLIGNVDGAAGADIIWLRDTASAPVWWSYLGP